MSGVKGKSGGLRPNSGPRSPKSPNLKLQRFAVGLTPEVRRWWMKHGGSRGAAALLTNVARVVEGGEREQKQQSASAERSD